MKKVTLKEFAEEVGQEQAARFLGVKQSAISKAIRTGRNVMVTVLGSGAVFAEELKSFPSQKRGVNLPKNWMKDVIQITELSKEDLYPEIFSHPQDASDHA